MRSRTSELVEAIQRRLPNVDVFWEKEPDPFFDNMPCTLVAVSHTTGGKVVMEYVNGLSDHSIETLADDFVAHLGSRVSK
jgi:hypothetical protein